MCTMGEEGTTSACLCVPPAPLGFLMGTIHGCMGTSPAGAARLRAGCCSSFPAAACCPTKVSNLGSILCLLRAPGGDGGLPSMALLGWGHFAISPYGHSLETAFLGHAHGRPAAHFRKPMSGAVPFSSGWRFALCSWDRALGDPGWAGRDDLLADEHCSCGDGLAWLSGGPLQPRDSSCSTCRGLAGSRGRHDKQSCSSSSGAEPSISLWPHCIVRSRISITRPSELVSFAQFLGAERVATSRFP